MKDDVLGVDFVLRGISFLCCKKDCDVHQNS